MSKVFKDLLLALIMYDAYLEWAKENNVKITESDLEKIVNENDSIPSAALKIMRHVDKRVDKLYGKIFSWLLSNGYSPKKVKSAAESIAYREPLFLYSFLEEVYAHKSPYGAISYALAVVSRSTEFSKKGDLRLQNAINLLAPVGVERKNWIEEYRKV